MNDAMPTTYSYYKAYSSIKISFNKKTANYNRYFNKRVNIVKSTRVNTARPKVEVNTVKASASWKQQVEEEGLVTRELVFWELIKAAGILTKVENKSLCYSCASGVENKSGIHTIRLRFYLTDAKNKKLDTPDHTIHALKNTAPMNIKNEEIEIGPVDVEWNKAIGNKMKKQRSGYKRDDIVILDVITAAIGANGICKELASLKQTALELAILGQTTNGKKSSNPFMAGSLPKTIDFCDSLPSDEDSFELIEWMILCTNFLTMVRDLENLKTSHLLKKDFLQIKRAEDDKEEFGYILLVIKKLTLKKLDD
ncbi:hypothetical protein Tco_0927115 [Tanacetum coccineum]|uniref:Uncharacterized protein n=1 Tax=Tanacetum coccineum TaxID=301880 RepID=A0ABQ5DBV3_9ASTR